MPTLDFDAIIEELRKHLDSSRQNWLFGAGISFNSNIPLMYPLTKRIIKIIGDSSNLTDKNILSLLTDELDAKSHIEHYLSHIGDLIAIADRSKSKTATFQKESFTKDELLHLHKSIITEIGNTVRYGYSFNGKDEIIGNSVNPIVEIEHHIKFVQSLYLNRANLTSRSKLTFFTTNYDTLLEDALGLEKFTVVDGFSGGAIAYWNPQFEFQNSDDLPNRCILYKLHGSIDWQRNDKKELVRTRYGTKYLADKSDIMIFPQATKYVETQKDPFSYLFQGFRNALNYKEDNVLIICGYGFGDEHINAEIEAALSESKNRTTLIAFAEEKPDGTTIVNEILDKWLSSEIFGNRVYLAGGKGIYYNSTTPITPKVAKDFSGWTFSGLTNFITTGEYE
jgi:hypothetical protein